VTWWVINGNGTVVMNETETSREVGAGHTPALQPDLSRFVSNLSWQNRLLRAIWGIAWLVLFRPTPRIAFGWRRWVLRLFGAKIGRGVRVYNSARVFYPPYLQLDDQSIVGPDVDLYCVAPIHLEANAMISQYAYLCAATHDYTLSHLPLVAKPITVRRGAWVCARAFVGPGLEIGEYAVVAAAAVVVKSVGPREIVGGNPAKLIKMREMRS
jgi:putative colanic acid biosynthesis acetyltransferase WcaF